MEHLSSHFDHHGPVVQAGMIEGGVHAHTNFNYSSAAIDTKLSTFVGPDIHFVGRKDELGRLKTDISRQPHIVVVSGLGGVGKTQLVRKFIEENKSSYDNIIWINAQGRAKIEEQFKILAKDSLNISVQREGKQREFDAIVKDVYAKLSETQAVIVFDNVDEKDDCKFALMLGTLGKKPHVIISSRIREWNVPKIELDVFSVTDALQYVSNKLIDKENEENDPIEDRISLVETLQKFPLALKQATAYIIHQRVVQHFRIVDYINEYNKKSVLDSKIFQDETNEYAETTFTTWRVTLAAIEKCGSTGDLALRILRIMAFFDPDRIRREIFFNLELSGIDIEEKVKTAVRLLVNYSIVNSHQHQSVLSVHRLVQQVIQIELEIADDVMKTILRDGLRLIWKLERDENYNEVHQHGAKIFLTAVTFHEIIEEFLSLAAKIVGSFNASFKFSEAINFGNQILVSLTDILRAEKTTTIYLKTLIAFAYTSIGEDVEYIRMQQELYEHNKELRGEDHPDTLINKNNIAQSFSIIGNYSEALRIHQEIYDQKKIILGENHASTISTKSCIAYQFSRIGKCSEALQMYEEVYERRRNILGEDHPDTLMSNKNVVWCKGKIKPDK